MTCIKTWSLFPFYHQTVKYRLTIIVFFVILIQCNLHYNTPLLKKNKKHIYIYTHTHQTCLKPFNYAFFFFRIVIYYCNTKTCYQHGKNIYLILSFSLCQKGPLFLIFLILFFLPNKDLMTMQIIIIIIIIIIIFW